MVIIASVSYLAALVASLLLFVLLLTAWRGRLQGLPALLGVGGILIWSSLHLAATFEMRATEMFIALANLIRNAGLLVLLTSAITPRTTWKTRMIWSLAIPLAILATLGFIILPKAVPDLSAVLSPNAASKLAPYFWLIVSILGLLLIEQVYRNAPQSQRWTIKHFCLGIGVIFAYDLFFFSDTILLQRIDPNLSQARGIVTAMAIPLIAVSVARNPIWSLDIHVSRSVVFHSATLLGSGIYLMAMALAGYYVRAFSGAWGATLQIAFLFAAGLFLLTLLFSGHLRAKLRVLLNEHFFSFKYDYRSEWRRFTENLATTEDSPPRAIIQAISSIVASPGGLLWVTTDGGSFACIEKFMAESVADSILIRDLTKDDPMVGFMEESGLLIDLVELRTQPDHYPGLDPPNWILDCPELWLVIPLFFRNRLIGLTLLLKSPVIRYVNWEDRGLLKTASLQAAGVLAQYLSDQALMRARQFEAFNQLAAYVAHDLKNLIAQQSLIVTNAEKHKDNPEFIADVFATIKNSVERMERLMIQLRHGRRDIQQTPCSLAVALEESMARLGSKSPIPILKMPNRDIQVLADEERLVTAIGHLVQNACEATTADGRIEVHVMQDGATAILRIRDDGIGMSQAFIHNRLFKPFDSTKGLTGMGIGAFESREYFHGIGGRLAVESEPGVGTVFTIRIPCLTEHESRLPKPNGEAAA